MNANMTWEDFIALLAKEFDGFKRREVQDALAEAAGRSWDHDRHILAQAGCGVGKSFVAAFRALLQALKTGKPVGLATATKALQDQYGEKDLPFLASLIPGLKYVVLKGRSNYVCLAKLDELEDASLKSTARKGVDAEGFSGEIMDLGLTPEESVKLSTSSDECPGKKECPFGDVCFAERAKAKARESHIVVANHAVVAADLAVKDAQEQQGVARPVGILPDLGGIIVDEGHEFQDSVTNALGGQVTGGSYGRLGKEVANFFNDRHAADDLDKASAAMFAEVAKVLASRDDKRNNTLRIDGVALAKLGEPAVGLNEALFALVARIKAVKVHGDDKKAQQVKRLVRKIENAATKLNSFVMASDTELVRWLEVAEGKKGDSMNWAPIKVDEFLARNLWSKMPGLVMSATLALGNDFSYMQSELGIEQADVFDVGTPFDFRTQAMVLIPDLPIPAGSTVGQWRAGLLAIVSELLKASKGSGMLLFTSRTEMEEAHRFLAPKLQRMGHTALKQGEAPNKVLAKRFYDDKSSVLFGLASFGTGVDFQGETLRMLVINKLPFPVPTDVVMAARVDLADMIARNWNEKGFNKITVPYMALRLFQWFGRGVRSVDDKCLIVIGDSRLYGKNRKSYGARIMSALPNAPVTQSLDEAIEFLESAS